MFGNNDLKPPRSRLSVRDVSWLHSACDQQPEGVHQNVALASFHALVRNVLVTAPYFHDGSMETLWDAVDHYNKGDGLKEPWLDDDIEPLALTENEIDDLVAFMASLTSPEYKEIGIKELARQRALARISRPQRDTARAFGPKPERPKAPSLTNDSSHP